MKILKKIITELSQEAKAAKGVPLCNFSPVTPLREINNKKRLRKW